MRRIDDVLYQNKLLLTKKTFLFVVVFILLHSICFAQNWDIDILKKINLHRNHSLDDFFLFFTNYAAPIAYSIPFFLFLLAILKQSTVLKEKSVYLIQSGALALIVSTLLKAIVNRPRPYVTYPFLEKLSTGGSGSFPSGHTSDAFTLAASLSFAFPKWYIIVPSFAWAITVGYSRMHLGVHYPSDVAASVLLGGLCSWLTYKWKGKNKKKQLNAEAPL